MSDTDEALLVELVKTALLAVVRLANAIGGADRVRAILDAEHAASNAEADAIERRRFPPEGEMATGPATPDAKKEAGRA